MDDDRSLVEQAHQIQALAKELENNGCDELLDKFVAGCITAKLSPSWLNFATSIKHERQEFSATDLIGSLGVTSWPNQDEIDLCGPRELYACLVPPC